VEILRTIGSVLASQFQEGHKLSGVIYMQRITDPRMSGIARRNFNMLNKLCGPDFMENVVITTTRWNEVDYSVGCARERELQTKDIFFKPALEENARYIRHDNGIHSARDIVRYILHKPPRALLIQVEMIEQRKAVSETSAGKELQNEFSAQMEKQAEEMHELKKQMDLALKERDEEAQRELHDELDQKRSLLAHLKAQMKEMSQIYKPTSQSSDTSGTQLRMSRGERSTVESADSHVEYSHITTSFTPTSQSSDTPGTQVRMSWGERSTVESVNSHVEYSHITPSLTPMVHTVTSSVVYRDISSFAVHKVDSPVVQRASNMADQPVECERPETDPVYRSQHPSYSRLESGISPIAFIPASTSTEMSSPLIRQTHGDQQQSEQLPSSLAMRIEPTPASSSSPANTTLEQELDEHIFWGRTLQENLRWIELKLGENERK